MQAARSGAASRVATVSVLARDSRRRLASERVVRIVTTLETIAPTGTEAPAAHDSAA